MVKAIFRKAFHYTSRTRNAGWSIPASEKAQTWPREVVDAAVAAGVAEIVPPRRSRTAKAPDDRGGGSARSSKRNAT